MNKPVSDVSVSRRSFVRQAVGAVGAVALASKMSPSAHAADSVAATADAATLETARPAAPVFTGEQLDQVAFPMGGIGAGTICLDGAGGLTHVSLRHRPQIDQELDSFAAISIRSPEKIARVLEGPASRWRLYSRPGAAKGDAKAGLGLPRCERAAFHARFPFGHVALEDEKLPLTTKITGWSPFEPGDADNASLPVAGVEYTFTNRSATGVEAVFSFNLRNPVAVANCARNLTPARGGFIFHGAAAPEKPEESDAWFSVATDDPAVKVNHAWFRGHWFDAITMAWRDVESGAAFDRPPATSGQVPDGGTIFVPFSVSPGASKTIRLRLAWYVPRSNVRDGTDRKVPGEFYRAWYAGRFASIDMVTDYWREHYDSLRERAARFSGCFYDSTLPSEAIEAVAANLCILKSPTVMRQADGKFWGWEGCDEKNALGHGTCTHVWNYAQALAHLFPSLERSIRETEFTCGQDERGHQQFRVPIPIQPANHDFHAAVDGQLGGIIKTYREWRISGDLGWLRTWWPKLRVSLDYCIETWDPRHVGWIEEPHHNTYDIEFWGPTGMAASYYLTALQAAVAMGQALGENTSLYERLLAGGKPRVNTELFNGEYFVQKVEWKNLRAKNPAEAQSIARIWDGGYSPEAKALLEAEGPKYQYGDGCLSDGVVGAWLARVCGVGPVLDPEKEKSHLRAVHRYNLKHDLKEHVNPQRPSYANGRDGGLLLCTWPRGGQPALPFVYSNEVWTGIEYQAAGHMIMMGLVDEGLQVVRVCRARYDGKTRNPFDEYEWGHWYARAMASYALLQALGGARYDAVEQVLYLAPAIRGDFHGFLATATGYGTVGVRSGKPFFTPTMGEVKIARIEYTPRV